MEEEAGRGRNRIRRLALVEEADEHPAGGQAAVRRYRLARLERVAEASPVGDHDPATRSREDDAPGRDPGRRFSR